METIMYTLNALPKAMYDEKLRATAGHHPYVWAAAGRRTRNQGGWARRLSGMSVLHVLHGRRAAQAY
jgi:hypothetical protein